MNRNEQWIHYESLLLDIHLLTKHGDSGDEQLAKPVIKEINNG